MLRKYTEMSQQGKEASSRDLSSKIFSLVTEAPGSLGFSSPIPQLQHVNKSSSQFLQRKFNEMSFVGLMSLI